MADEVMDLVSSVHLRWKRRVARDLLPYGLSPKQIFVLRQLAESEDGLAPSRIAQLVFADRPSATSMINTLERAGFVRRRAHPTDGRQVQVEITAAGRRKLASVPLRLWRSGHTSFDPVAGLTPRERSQLALLLKKVEEALRAETEGESTE